MARQHGRNAQMYVANTSGGSAAPFAYAAEFEIDLSLDQKEVTAFGDSQKTYVAGFADGKIKYKGFLSDTAGSSLVAGAIDGAARKFYLYPFNTTAIYFFGTGFVGTTVKASADGPVEMEGEIVAASAIGTIGF